MPRPSIAHGLFTWQDGRPALEAALRSTAGYVDHVLIADGLIDGVPSSGLPELSDLSWLPQAGYLPMSRGNRREHPLSDRDPWVAAHRWPGLSAACSWLLDRARYVGADWLLYIDADQELHGGQYLHEWLSGWDGDAFPIQRIDGPGPPVACPWQCVRVAAFKRYVAGCYIVETASGTVVDLAPRGSTPEPLWEYRPWISHHPERRPPWRRDHRLGSLETILEPPPPGVEPLRPGRNLLQSAAMDVEQPAAETQSAGSAASGSEAVSVVQAPAYYCPGCGKRYFGPGTCTNQHAAIELERDPAIETPEDSLSDSPAPPAAAAEQAAAGTDPAQPAEPGPVAAAPPAVDFDAALRTLDELRVSVLASFDQVEQAIREAAAPTPPA
jgi:hypothetical protein